jgi:hypothetical protein
VPPKLVHRQINNPYNAMLNMRKFRVIRPNIAAPTPIVQPFLEIISSRGDLFHERVRSTRSRRQAPTRA